MKDIINGKICQNENPIFIVKMGPPGSGKSYIVNKLLDEEKISDKFVSFNLDEFIESNDIFITESRKIYEENYNTDKKIELVKNLYFDRKQKTKISEKLDEILYKSLENKCNIIYEITGRIDTIEWITELKNIENYELYIIYVYSDLQDITKRVHERGIISYEEGNSYRNIKDNDIKIIYDNAKNTFNKYKNTIKFIKIKNKTGESPKTDYGDGNLQELLIKISDL